MACTNGGKMLKINVNDFITKLEVYEFSQESIVPGVYSNLRKVRNYRWFLNGQFDMDMDIIGLQMDSVLVPVRSVKSNGNKVSNTSIPSADFGNYEFNASRNFYNSAAEKRLEEVQYEKMEPILEGTLGILWLSRNGKKVAVDLGEADVKKTIIAP